MFHGRILVSYSFRCQAKGHKAHLHQSPVRQLAFLSQITISWIPAEPSAISLVSPESLKYTEILSGSVVCTVTVHPPGRPNPIVGL